MTTYPSYVDLDVWKKSRTLCGELIKVSREFPSTEQSGFAHNLQTIALALPSMIAKSLEAYGSEAKILKSREAIETIIALETRVHVAQDLGLIKEESAKSLFEELTICKKMLFGMIKYQRKKES